MDKFEKICIIGGDLRAVLLGGMLVEAGYSVTYYALEKRHET